MAADMPHHDLVRIAFVSSLLSTRTERRKINLETSLSEEQMEAIRELGKRICLPDRYVLCVGENRRDLLRRCLMDAHRFTASVSDLIVNTNHPYSYADVLNMVRSIIDNADYMSSVGNETDFTQSAIGVFIDHKRCELPLSDQIWTNIRNGLRALGFLGEVNIFVVGDMSIDPLLTSRHILVEQEVDASIINPYVSLPIQFLSSTTENLSIGPKDTTDKEIIIQSMSWASSHSELHGEPGMFLGITNDPEFRHAISKLKKKNFKVLIANNLSNTEANYIKKFNLWKSQALHFLSLENLLNGIIVHKQL